MREFWWMVLTVRACGGVELPREAADCLDAGVVGDEGVVVDVGSDVLGTSEPATVATNGTTECAAEVNHATIDGDLTVGPTADVDTAACVVRAGVVTGTVAAGTAEVVIDEALVCAL